MKNDESSNGDQLLENYRVAKSEDATWEQLQPLIESGDEQLIRAAAKNPNIPAEELTKLADHESALVVDSVAENRSTPPETLWALAKRELPVNNLFIHEDVAGNIAAPRELLEYMTDNTNNWNVIEKIAENPATPEDILERFLDDGFGSGRQFLSHVDNPSGEFRSRESHLAEVQDIVADRKNLSVELARKIIPVCASSLSSNYYAPREVLEELVRDHPDRYVRDNAYDILNPPDLS